VVQNTGEMSGQPLRVLVAPAMGSDSELYEDDGESMQYKNGDFMTRRFQQTASKDATVIDVGVPEGRYRPAPRNLVLETWVDHAPTAITVQSGEALPHVDAVALANAPRGWTFANGMVTVKVPDNFEAARFTIEK
jgi:alpha-glucosidase